MRGKKLRWKEGNDIEGEIEGRAREGELGRKRGGRARKGEGGEPSQQCPRPGRPSVPCLRVSSAGFIQA